jgi:AcrR family transcriptional regulator
MVRNLQPNKREAFLTAALDLFVRSGVQNTSTAEIARQAGAAAGTLFLYFPTKQELVDALALKIGQAQADNINSLLEPSLSARESFFVIWNASIVWFQNNVAAYRYIRQVRDSGMLSPAVVQESARYFSFYYAAIQKGLAEGAIKPYPPDLIGAFIYQDIVAAMDLVLTQPEPVKQAEIVRVGFDIFWDGIKTGDRRPSEEEI